MIYPSSRAQVPEILPLELCNLLVEAFILILVLILQHWIHRFLCSIREGIDLD